MASAAFPSQAIRNRFYKAKHKRTPEAAVMGSSEKKLRSGKWTSPLPQPRQLDFNCEEHGNQLDATPLGDSVQNVSDLIEKAMMPEVVNRHGQAASLGSDVIYVGETQAAVEAASFDFEIGDTVEAHSLATVAMNGLRGEVVGFQDERVKVNFPDGTKALKPANLKLVQVCFGKWTQALKAGDYVEVLEAFDSNGDGEAGDVVALAEGLHGTILQIDSDGDAEVDFPPISKPQFVFKSSFDKLKIIDEKDLGDNHGMSKPQQIISLECESEETDEADAIDVYEKTTQDRRDLASYHGLLQTRVKAGDQRGAWRVVSDMQVNGVSPTTATCSILLKGKLESIEEVSRVLVLVDTMEEPMDDVFFAALAEACIGVRRLDVL